MLIIRLISEDDLWYLKQMKGVFLGPTSIFGKFFTDFRKMMILLNKKFRFFQKFENELKYNGSYSVSYAEFKSENRN